MTRARNVRFYRSWYQMIGIEMKIHLILSCPKDFVKDRLDLGKYQIQNMFSLLVKRLRGNLHAQRDQNIRVFYKSHYQMIA